MKCLITVFTFLIIGGSQNLLYAQLNDLKPLKSGDTLPNLKFTLHIGNTTQNINLKDYNGKAILLDFWGVYCGECIAKMPHMLELQKQFKDSLQILIVTPYSQKDVNDLWTRLKGEVPGVVLEAGQRTPIIVSDTQFKKLFPYNGVPMHVWIDRHQIYRIATDGSNTDSTTLKQFFNGNTLNLSPYRLVDIDGFNAESWMDKRIGYADHLLSYSIFSKFDEKSNSGGYTALVKDSITNKFGLICYNKPIGSLIKYAFLKNNSTIDQQILFMVKDKEKYIPPKASSKFYNIWITKNLYCYALKTNYRNTDSVFNRAQKEITDFFHLHVIFKYIKMPCWVLISLPNTNNLYSKGGEQKDEFLNLYTERKLILQNVPISILYDKIKNYYIPVNKLAVEPFIDKTQMDHNIDIELPWGGYNVDYSIPKLRLYLQQNGLDLIKRDELLKVLVVTEK